MKKISLKVLTLLAALTTAGLAVAQTGNDEPLLAKIAGYKQWTRASREVIQVAPAPTGETAV